ncbi:hypothetical protein BBK36DRAFT_6457 [Trichoderma citrinoviride]|uniref:Uncharacterized protein n=1 Tax=Trichoderma citrinoviride TaxID=58853 RepID=A0A2T4B486_9HYPO|nr:hypothetical protein BBK36DRAFT_6457 [Trichoderma citrinoviride]PTB64132.1 hypothetical protein BBK36DRAFT_6457 [Trichoderma citrinoviride]
MRVGGKRCDAVFRALCSVHSTRPSSAFSSTNARSIATAMQSRTETWASRVVIVIAMGLTSGTGALHDRVARAVDGSRKS